jgi:hypothetical protein
LHPAASPAWPQARNGDARRRATDAIAPGLRAVLHPADGTAGIAQRIG